MLAPRLFLITMITLNLLDVAVSNVRCVAVLLTILLKLLKVVEVGGLLLLLLFVAHYLQAGVGQFPGQLLVSVGRRLPLVIHAAGSFGRHDGLVLTVRGPR